MTLESPVHLGQYPLNSLNLYCPEISNIPLEPLESLDSESPKLYP